MKARLCGFGFWAPGYRGVAEWAAGAPPNSEAAEPDASVLPSRLRRRTAPLTRMVCDVITQAAREGDADLSRAKMVLSSAWGEFDTTIQLLHQLTEPHPQVSPTLFHNSVHNTATGYLSIALENSEASTAIGAGRGSLCVGLIEALSEIEVDGGEVLLVVADEPIPAPFAEPVGEPLALALCLRPLDAPRRGTLDVVLTLHRGARPEGSSDDAPIPAALAANPCAVSLPLARAIAAGGPARLALEGGGGDWMLELRPEVNS